MISVATFRTNTSPAFNDSSRYTDAAITFYLALAYAMMNVDRWGASGSPNSLLDFGATFMTAHYLSLDAAVSAGGSPGVPGSGVGVLSGGTVDKVSFTRDVASTAVADAGHWNSSTYGQRYYQMMLLVGAGPIQVGLPTLCDFSGTPWQGPLWNWW